MFMRVAAGLVRENRRLRRELSAFIATHDALVLELRRVRDELRAERLRAR